MLIIVFFLFLLLLIILINNNSTKTISHKELERDYWDDKIIDQTLNPNRRVSDRIRRSSVERSEPDSVKIDTYHESNKTIGGVKSEYIRKYHEAEGVFYRINPADADDYIMHYVITIWNSELVVKKVIKDTSLSGLIVQCENQFRIWAQKVERGINKKREPASRIKSEENLLSENQYPDLTFELKGLFYRSAQAQLEATLLEVGDSLLLEEEPNNEQDCCAIKVLTQSGECIGYVDKECSAIVSSMLDCIESCTVFKKTRHKIPYITVNLHFKR